MMKSIRLIIGLFLLTTSISFGQTYLTDRISNVAIKSDSLYERFVSPVLPDVLFSEACSYDGFIAYSFEILCTVSVDTNRKVNSLHLYPLYEAGNNLPDTSYIWKEILSSIDSVSKLWIFKPILHKINDDYNESEKEYFKNVNNGLSLANKRPFLGKQYHTFILSITMPCWEKAEPNFLYLLHINPKRKQE